MKKRAPKTNRNQVHTAKSSKGLGDYYGTGIKQPLGRVRDDTMGMVQMTPKKLRKPPKSTA